MMKYSKLILKGQVFTGERIKNFIKLANGEVDIYLQINGKHILALDLEDKTLYKAAHAFNKESRSITLCELNEVR